jgi:hypothetical protein
MSTPFYRFLGLDKPPKFLDCIAPIAPATPTGVNAPMMYAYLEAVETCPWEFDKDDSDYRE